MKKLDFNKILEIAAGVAAVLVALGNFLSAVISPVKTFVDDGATVSKVFKILLGLEKGLLNVFVIVLGFALILRWVSQNKMRWVVFGSSAFAACLFVFYRLTNVIYSIMLSKSSQYVTTNIGREVFIFLLFAVSALICVFLVYDSQANVIKKDSRTKTLVAAYTAVGVLMFIAMSMGLRAGSFVFPLLIIVSVLWRNELPKTTPVYFGFGGAAVTVLLSFFNAFYEPLGMILTKIDFFGKMLNYNDSLIIISTALIPLLFLSREFNVKKE